jgi:hypothetical protein
MTSRESKHDRFRRLATRRTNTVLHRLQILSYCANPQLYDYSDEDVRKMFRAIESELRRVKARFTNSSKSQFSL